MFVLDFSNELPYEMMYKRIENEILAVVCLDLEIKEEAIGVLG